MYGIGEQTAWHGMAWHVPPMGDSVIKKGYLMAAYRRLVVSYTYPIASDQRFYPSLEYTINLVPPQKGLVPNGGKAWTNNMSGIPGNIVPILACLRHLLHI